MRAIDPPAGCSRKRRLEQLNTRFVVRIVDEERGEPGLIARQQARAQRRTVSHHSFRPSVK
eukprot:5601695-Prymnesium_polylepis.1